MDVNILEKYIERILKFSAVFVISYFKKQEDIIDITDCGTNSSDSCDYPDFAFKLGEAVVSKEVDFGVAICGSGIGIGIACNKVKGVRCAKVDNVEDAALTRLDNDSNVIAISYVKDINKLCLKNVNLEIKSGETIGIIGGTGSSKSSFVQLIPRLYDVTTGRLKVGGVDVRDYDIQVLRNEVAMVLQKNVLFSGTIKENLRWGNKEATDEEMIKDKYVFGSFYLQCMTHLKKDAKSLENFDKEYVPGESEKSYIAAYRELIYFSARMSSFYEENNFSSNRRKFGAGLVIVIGLALLIVAG